MNKLDVGTRIKIKSKKWYNTLKSSCGIPNWKIHFGFNSDMSEYCGKTGIITRAYYNSCSNCYDYSLDLDKGRWHWSEDMFEEKKVIGIEIE